MNKMSFIQSMRAYNLEYKLEKISIKSYRWLWTANWFFNGEPPKLPTKAYRPPFPTDYIEDT